MEWIINIHPLIFTHLQGKPVPILLANLPLTAPPLPVPLTSLQATSLLKGHTTLQLHSVQVAASTIAMVVRARYPGLLEEVKLPMAKLKMNHHQTQ